MVQLTRPEPLVFCCTPSTCAASLRHQLHNTQKVIVVMYCLWHTKVRLAYLPADTAMFLAQKDLEQFLGWSSAGCRGTAILSSQSWPSERKLLSTASALATLSLVTPDLTSHLD